MINRLNLCIDLYSYDPKVVNQIDYSEANK